MATDAEILREKLGEVIPPGGTEADTAFTEAQIIDLLARNDSVNAAIAEGWEIKAANYADLVNMAEGTTKRNFSDLQTQALRMAEHYGSGATGATAVTRIHKIVRS